MSISENIEPSEQELPSRAERIREIQDTLAGQVPLEKVTELSAADFKEHIEVKWDRIAFTTRTLEGYAVGYPEHTAMVERKDREVREAMEHMDAYEAVHGTAWMSA
ncbi:hypothetical protein [Citricoccus nitrophenolicus]|uniref:hypothetical protein n=1 Tax=Citricoccus nitrophenolicus TaxID=863575 RepID=UPI0031F141DD